MGATDFDDASRRIVEGAYRSSKARGGYKAFARKISGYATESNAECIAEAVADWYCNGIRSKPQSRAIMRELNKYRN